MRQSLWPTSQQPAVGVAAVIALIMIFFNLVIRQVLIVLLILLAPLAFAAYLLPNTEQRFTKWRKTFVALLMVFPVIGVVYGASTLVSDVVGGLYTRTDNEEQQIRELPRPGPGSSQQPQPKHLGEHQRQRSDASMNPSEKDNRNDEAQVKNLSDLNICRADRI